jgi:integrase
MVDLLRSHPGALLGLRFLRLEGEDEQYLVTTDVDAAWERAGQAGLPHVRIHDLRHQFASFLVNDGHSLYDVQKILGHSDPAVTQRYAHLSSASLQKEQRIDCDQGRRRAGGGMKTAD